MRRPNHTAPAAAKDRALAAALTIALLAFGLPATASDGGYPPPPGPYPFELPPVQPPQQVGERAPAGTENQAETTKPAPAATPRSQATHLFGAAPAARPPAIQPVRPAAPVPPHRPQPYAAPGYPAAPAFSNQRPAAPARPPVQTRAQPSGNTAATAPESARSLLQTPDPMAGGSRFRPPEPGEAR